MALFSTGPHPVIEALQGLAVEELSPLEAINKLYELKRMVEAKELSKNNLVFSQLARNHSSTDSG